MQGFGFLPYQIKYYKDTSRFKIVEKSRRIGFTYIQAFEDVIDCASQDRGTDVWFSSADITAAKEYIKYCGMWAETLNIAAKDLGEVVLEGEKDIKVLSIEMANGKRINALSSNPKQFRSKGGKVVLDEFAFHDNQDALWKAAFATAMRGDKIRVISTYNGKSNLYYRMVDDVKTGRDTGWSLHTVTIYDAINDGLLKSMGMDDTVANREQFIRECKVAAKTTEAFEQEYNCNPSDEGSAWLPYGLITPCQSSTAGKAEKCGNNVCYVGMDVGRHHDLSVIVVGEMVGDVLWIRKILRMKNMKYSDQHKILDGVYRQFRIVTGKFDSTGLGDAFVEQAAERLGSTRVQAVKFTNASKHELAICIKQVFEDVAIRIPAADVALREALHAVKQTTTATGSAPKFDAEHTDMGHADEFWAVALMVSASLNNNREYAYTPVRSQDDTPRNTPYGQGFKANRGIL